MIRVLYAVTWEARVTYKGGSDCQNDRMFPKISKTEHESQFDRCQNADVKIRQRASGDAKMRLSIKLQMKQQQWIETTGSHLDPEQEDLQNLLVTDASSHFGHWNHLGELKKPQCSGHGSEQLNQNVWTQDPSIQVFFFFFQIPRSMQSAARLRPLF